MNNPHKTSKRLKVLIVGCGNIAGAFDSNLNSENFPFTHAGSYTLDNRFTISACIEPDENRRRDFMEKWNVNLGYSSIAEILNLGFKFDIISICSPTINHSHDIEVAVHLKPKLIFCEKPIAASLIDAERLVELCKIANIKLAVNHTRRWDLSLLSHKKNISAGRWGDLRSVIGIYNKGILNNGSHMLDLLHFLLGPINIIKVGKPINDYLNDDPTIPVFMENEQGVPIHLSSTNAKDYAEFELQLFFSLGVLSMEEGGMYWSERVVEDSATFKNYRVLGEGRRYASECKRSMLKAIDNIYNAITYDEDIVSSGDTAILAHRMCEKIKLMSFAEWSNTKKGK
jgi:predicted dehydrogenase